MGWVTVLLSGGLALAASWGLFVTVRASGPQLWALNVAGRLVFAPGGSEVEPITSARAKEEVAAVYAARRRAATHVESTEPSFDDDEQVVEVKA